MKAPVFTFYCIDISWTVYEMLRTADNNERIERVFNSKVCLLSFLFSRLEMYSYGTKKYADRKIKMPPRRPHYLLLGSIKSWLSNMMGSEIRVVCIQGAELYDDEGGGIWGYHGGGTEKVLSF